MQISPTHSTYPVHEVNEYTLAGGVTVRDKTNGIAKAIYSPESTSHFQRSAYDVRINDKKLIFPTTSDPFSKEAVVFAGSLKLSFKPVEEFIKIKEVDASSKTVFYVDPRKNVEGIAYDVYSYIPVELKYEQAMQKIEHMKTNFPNFNAYNAVYNRHGVAVFGWDEDLNKYAICWANPHEEKVRMIDCTSIDSYRDGGSFHAKSRDRQVNFRNIFGKGCYLNAEPASHLSL